MKRNLGLLIFLTVWFLLGQAQDPISSNNGYKSFFNLSFMGMASTNGYYYKETANNVSIGLIHAGAENVYGFSLAPFSYIESSMHGVQLGLTNGVRTLKGLQAGFGNGAWSMNGVQVGFVNSVVSFKGVQLGIINMKNCFENSQGGRTESGLQIGLINIADHNDYPIGFVNLIKDGDMNVGMQTDEMSSMVATFRSGGRYLYGVVGIGASFSSSIHHTVVEGGIGAHLHLSKQFRIDTEIVLSDYEKTLSGKWKETEEEFEKRKERHDFRQAFRASIRVLPNIRFGKHIEIFGGPSINYLHSNNVKNEKIFPSQYWWRNFDSSCFKQVYLGWIVGTQYRF